MNYNTLRNKPTINHKELIGNNKASDIGGMTEEDMEQLLTTDLTHYYTKDQIDDLFSRSFVYREKSGSIVTFDCPSTSQSIPEVTAEIVAVQSGSGDPSPTNVRPISGWSAVNVYDTGKNFFDEANPNKWIFTDGQLSDDEGSMTSQLVTAKEGVTYVLSSGITAVAMCICFYDKNMNLINRVAHPNVNKISSTAPINSCYLYASVFKSHNNLQLEIGTTATTYEPYNGTTYTIDLDGTRYGGTLDVVSGELKVVPYYASYNGETLEGEWISDRDVYAVGTTPTIGAQVVNIGATPQTIQLTPTAVKSLLGTNNLWADTGDIEVKCLDRIIPAEE